MSNPVRLFTGILFLKQLTKEVSHIWGKKKPKLGNIFKGIGLKIIILYISAWTLKVIRHRLHAKSLQSCLTLCDPMDCSPPGSSVHGILQTRILEWVAISFSKGSSWPRDRTCISCICRRILYYWTTWETQSDMNSVLFSKNCVPNFTLPDCSRHTDMASSLCSRFLTELCFCLGNPPSYTWPYVSVSQFQ